MSDVVHIIGETVPWSSAWTGEIDFGIAPSADFPGLYDLVQKEAVGEGEPLFAAMHVTRNRRAMFGHLCHVCGDFTPEGDRWLFPLQTGGMVRMHDGTERYGGNVPPVHLDCATRAQRLCPHLRRGAEPVRFPEDAGRVIQRTDVLPGMEDLAKTLQPGVPVVFGVYRLHGPEFTELVQQLERDAGARRPEIKRPGR